MPHISPATTDRALRIYLLGPLRVERGSQVVHLPRRKVESLLAYLVLNPEAHPRENLATLFWGDSPDAQARKSLRTALPILRRELMDDPYTSHLVKQGKWYPLVDLRTETDTLKFLGGEYPVGLLATADMIQHRPQTVQKVVNAIVLALRYIATHTPEEITAILPKDVILIASDKPAYVDGIQNSLPAFSKDGLMAEAGIKDWIDVEKAFGAIKPDQVIDVPALYTTDFVNQAK